MRILINALHSKTGGGLVYLAGILPHLVQREGVEWHLLLPEESAEKVDVPGNVVLHVVSTGGFLKTHLWEQLILPFLCRRWRINKTLCNANFAPLLAPRPSVILHSTPEVVKYVDTLWEKVYWRVLKVLTFVSIWRSEHVFAVSGAVAAAFGAKDAVITPAGMDWAAIDKITVEKNKATPSVVTVGDFYPQKDYVGLLRVFVSVHREFPEARLVIVGRPVQQKVEDEVEKIIQVEGLADAVLVTGAMPHEKVLETIAGGSVYVSASLVESFNMPLVEAMALGTPIVAKRLAHYEEELTGTAAVLVETKTAMAREIVALLRDETRRKELAEKGREQAKKFVWAETAKKVLDTVC